MLLSGGRDRLETIPHQLVQTYETAKFKSILFISDATLVEFSKKKKKKVLINRCDWF